MARPNPRRRLDVMIREAERALAERRDVVLLTDAALDQAAVIWRSDVDLAIDFWRTANMDIDVEQLLDGPPGEAEQDA